MFWFVSIAYGLIAGHRWKEPVSVLFGSSTQVFIYIDEIPQDFSSLNHPNSLSCFS